MRSFRDHSRAGHLCWGPGDVEMIVAEDSIPIYPHLQHLDGTQRYDSYLSDHPEHDLTPHELEAFAEHVDSLSPDERRQVHGYKRDSEDFNRPLRTGTGIVPGHILVSKVRTNDPWSVAHQKARLENYGHLDRVTSLKLPRDMTLYRGMTHASEIHTIPVGGHFVDHGYTGTSLLKNTALSYAGTHDNYDVWNTEADPHVPRSLDRHQMLAKIHAPAGTLGHYLNADPAAPYGHEHEVLLHRGTRFQVLGHERAYNGISTFDGKPKGVHLIHMRVVGHNPLPLTSHHLLDKDPDDE